jgi:hypothetical protein
MHLFLVEDHRHLQSRYLLHLPRPAEGHRVDVMSFRA